MTVSGRTSHPTATGLSQLEERSSCDSCSRFPIRRLTLRMASPLRSGMSTGCGCSEVGAAVLPPVEGEAGAVSGCAGLHPANASSSAAQHGAERKLRISGPSLLERCNTRRERSWLTLWRRGLAYRGPLPGPDPEAPASRIPSPATPTAACADGRSPAVGRA